MTAPLALVLVGLLALPACGSKKAKGPPRRDPDVIRYRLLLRENPIDSQSAFRCYGACQAEETPDGYLNCLRDCPGFDTTPGLTCADYEIPPHAACITARRVPIDDELDPGWVVVGVIAQTAIIVSLASVCASNSSQCGGGMPLFPPPR